MRKSKRCPVCRKDIQLIYFNFHLDIHKQRLLSPEPLKLICKYCENTHDGYYGSGIFCSAKCARGFSSQEKRAEINAKVSKKLTGRKLGWDNAHNRLATPPIIKICKFCKNEFTVMAAHKNQIFCSQQCGASCPETKDKLSKKAHERLESGHVVPFGTKCSFVYKDQHIRCDSILEYTCLYYILDNYSVSELDRCKLKISYKNDDGSIRTYNPDFQFTTITGDIVLVECKAINIKHFLGSEFTMWRNYSETGIIKEKVLEKYCIENNYKLLWFNQDTDKKRYRKICKQLRDERKALTLSSSISSSISSPPQFPSPPATNSPPNQFSTKS